MIVNEKTEIIIWQPFKNYSTSINRFFAQHHSNFKIIKNLKLPDNITYSDRKYSSHGHELPTRYENYTKFLPVRNPYERVISQWKYYIKEGGDFNFDEWLLTCSTQPIMYPVTKIYKYDILIKVELLYEELRKYKETLGIQRPLHEFPHLNKSDIEDPILTQPQKDFIYYFHYSDFNEGGYSR